MLKIVALICLGSALVAVIEGQDMTSMMFQAMGMEPPIMPPTMPKSLREHLYPSQSQMNLQQQQLALQRQRALALAAAREQQRRQQQQTKQNPYSVSYSSSLRGQPRENSVYSPANMIRRPGTANTVTSVKENPYSNSYRVNEIRQRSQNAAPTANPYSFSRAAGSAIPAIRNSAIMAARGVPPQMAQMDRTMRTMKAIRNQPKLIRDAKLAGCTLPVDSTAASVLMFNSCRTQVAQAVCQVELMQCNDIGMAAMCCPLGMNRLAMDTITYVNKLQRYMSEVA